MIDTLEELKALMRAERLATLTRKRASPLVSLVEAIAGEPVPGSWWSHPRGGRIYALTNALDDSGEVLVTKLADARVTFVHETLFPAFYRIAAGETRQTQARAGLP